MNSDPDDQPPFLSFGFRPFFLFAGIYGAVVMSAWLGWLLLHTLSGVLINPTFAGAPHHWHGHEMIFGYAGAVLSGFMLTAMPNWTGARRIAGTPLVLLVTVWLAGRAVMWFSAILPPIVTAITDAAYLPLLALLIAGGLLARPVWRHLIFLVFILLLAAANIAVHAEWLGIAEGVIAPALAASLLLLAAMVAVIGGRIVPAFTRNVLVRAGAEGDALPRSFPWIDRLAIGSIALLAILAAAQADGAIPATIAAIACAANLARIAFWRTVSTLKSPVLWSLHLAHLLLAIGFGILAISQYSSVVPTSSAMHFIAIGGIGTMTLAVMTRAALGHTGRPIAVGRPIALAYCLIASAGIARSLGPAVLPQYYTEVLAVSATMWIAAFAIFTAIYAPILLGPSKKAV